MVDELKFEIFKREIGSTEKATRRDYWSSNISQKSLFNSTQLMEYYEATLKSFY